MEKLNNKINAKMFINTLKLYIAMSVAGILATPSESFSQTTNNNNISLNITKISISEYENFIKKRDDNIKKKLDKFENHGYTSTIDYLEQTQRQIFLNSYKNNKNMVRNNINKIWDILKNKYWYKLSDDPIEILNTAIIQIAQSGKIDNLSRYSNGIIMKNFDINTINAHGFIESHYKNLWQVSNGELSPTFNPSAIGWLVIYIQILENALKTTNYEQYTPIQKPTEVKKEKIIETKEDNISNEWVTSISLDQSIWVINLDENRVVIIEDKPMIEKKPIIKNEPIIEQKNIIENKPIVDDQNTVWRVIKNDNSKGNSSTINLDTKSSVINLDSWHSDTTKNNNVNVNKNEDQTDWISNQKSEEIDLWQTTKKTINIWLDDIETNEILQIVESMSWNNDILTKNLSKDKLNWISYQEIIDVVWWFKDNELKKAFMYHLLNNDIISAQRVMWMELNCHTRYPEYKAGTKIWKAELQKIKKLWETRRYMGQNEIMANASIPQDVKNTYMKFVNWEFNNKWKSYTILSKTDFNIYLFSNNHRLLSRQNALIGKEVWDHQNNPTNWSRTTPGGLYEVWNSFEKSVSGENFFKKYGTHYVVLIPLQWQYKMSDKYTVWIHWTYENEPSRDTKIKSKNSADRRGGTGCINLEDIRFGEALNHLNIWWILFITYEPSKEDIEKFLSNKK